MHRNALLAAGKAQLFGGGGLDVDLVQLDLQVCGNQWRIDSICGAIFGAWATMVLSTLPTFQPLA
jgi:hypothetical protein